ERESRSLFGRLIAVAENYPELKTNTTVLNLQDSIRSIEEEIARQRYTYNNISQQYNILVDTIPSNFVAGILHLTKLEYLQFEEEIAKPPKIEF
ncbi:MAG: LemA family protein, partial [Methanoregulaceae archaeon]|nr:LemA family protein [Methanoregulaceae archaeon]